LAAPGTQRILVASIGSPSVLTSRPHPTSTSASPHDLVGRHRERAPASGFLGGRA
jgi:hypothetical protein